MEHVEVQNRYAIQVISVMKHTNRSEFCEPEVNVGLGDTRANARLKVRNELGALWNPTISGL